MYKPRSDESKASQQPHVFVSASVQLMGFMILVTIQAIHMVTQAFYVNSSRKYKIKYLVIFFKPSVWESQTIIASELE